LKIIEKGRMVSIFSLIFLILFAIVFAVGSTVGAEEKHETLKIGFCFDITAMGAEWFLPGKQALQMEFERINENGGVKIGDKIYDLELISETTNFTAEGAKAGAEKLVYKDKVKFMWGAGIMHTTMALQDVTMPNKIINFSQGFGRECLTGPMVDGQIVDPYPYKYTIMLISTSYEATPAMWRWVRGNYPDYKRVGALNINTTAAHWCTGEIAKRVLPIFGFEMVYEEYFDQGITDFYPLLTKLLAQNPDIIHAPNLGPTDWALLMKQAREMGFKGEGLFLLENPPTPGLIEIAGGKENVEGLINWNWPTDGEDAVPELVDFKNRYTEKYGQWVPAAMIPVRALPPLLEVLKILGTVDDSDKIMELLTSRRWESYGQEIAFGGEEYYGVPNMLVYPLDIIQMRDGVFEKVGVISIEDQLDFWENHQ